MFEKTQKSANPRLRIEKSNSGKPVAIVEELIKIKNLNQVCDKIQRANCNCVKAPGYSLLAAQILKVRGITCL